MSAFIDLSKQLLGTYNNKKRVNRNRMWMSCLILYRVEKITCLACTQNVQKMQQQHCTFLMDTSIAVDSTETVTPELSVQNKGNNATHAVFMMYFSCSKQWQQQQQQHETVKELFTKF